MKEEDVLEQRLKDFYDRVPDVEDALPFKDYLLKHEDSRMAWYLLGKQYEAKGQESKAIYCFSQAGEIYEAFENKPVPSLPESEQVWRKEPESKKRGGRWLVLAAALTLLVSGYLIYAGISAKPDRTHGSEEAAATLPAAPGKRTTDALPIASSPAATPEAPGFDTIAGAAEPDREGLALYAGMMASAGKSNALLVRAPRLGDFTDWVNSGEPVASATSGGTPGSAVTLWHDAKWCGCSTEDGKQARQMVEKWKPEQEAKLLLRSAMIQYKRETGSWPANPQALAGNYPNNTVAGWTEEMSKWFDELKQVLDDKKDGKVPLTVGWPQQAGSETSSGAEPSGRLAPLTSEPLHIIVDKTNHRLAVMSGNVLLRNYAVGLGGDRTPEGNFVISEKVRNPNGRSDGIFGSRGMTLSDTRYGIHGTDKPDSIGKDESQGCVRMAKEDLEELYDLVPKGTPVTIVKGGLPSETRVPPERFRLPSSQDETNPRKVYDWLT